MRPIYTPEKVKDSPIFLPKQISEDSFTLRFRKKNVTKFLIIFISFLIIWFVFTARSVHIYTDAPASTIKVNSWPSMKIADRWLVKKGEIKVEATSEGYFPLKQTILISEESMQKHKITLEPLPGNIDFSIEPAVDAVVYIDDKNVGNVPGTIRQIKAGKRKITVKANRYIPFIINFNVEGKNNTQNLQIKLEPAWADVQLESDPDRAEVYVDEEPHGVTALTFEVLQGSRTIMLKKDNYKTWEKNLQIKPGTQLNLGKITLYKADGYLSVRAKPAGATITLNGEFKGKTPITIKAEPDKIHRLRLIKEGYNSSDHEFTVKSKETKKMMIEMKPELASLEIKVEPDDAELLINGVSFGQANKTFSLPTHEHTIIIRRQGFGTYEKKITPRKNFIKQMTVRLKTLSELKRERTVSQKKFIKKSIEPKHEMKLFKDVDVYLDVKRERKKQESSNTKRRVILKRPFYLATKEVTNEQYKSFIKAHDSGIYSNFSLDQNTQPVSNVSWIGAALYCNWLSRRENFEPFYIIKYGELQGFKPSSTGYRLPTEAEWVYAAKMKKSGKAFAFSWGTDFPPKRTVENLGDDSAEGAIQNVIEGYRDGYAVSSPVASFPPNNKGIYDLGGNVSEWTHDFFEMNIPDLLEIDPLGPQSGRTHVIRGGSWKDSSPSKLKITFRTDGNYSKDNLGFRVARYAQ